MGKICKRGVPECVSQLNTPVIAFCYNWVLRNTLGDMGISTFSVLSFIYSFANAILSGVSQGLQPLWGQSFGQKDKAGLVHDISSGLKINAVCSVAIYGLLLIFRTPVVTLFNSDPALVDMASGALPIFALSFPFMAINLIFTAFFYSTKQTAKSDVIAVSRGILVKSLAIFSVPALFGSRFVWLAAVIAECITFIISLVCYKLPVTGPAKEIFLSKNKKY